MTYRETQRRSAHGRLATVALVLIATIGPGLVGQTVAPLTGLRLVSAEARSGSLQNPGQAIDGDARTELTFEWGNGGASLVIDLGGPRVLDRVRVTNGQANLLVWLTEVSVGPDATHFRPVLGRPVNLPMWRPGDATEVPLGAAPSAVSRRCSSAAEVPAAASARSPSSARRTGPNGT